MRWLTEGWLFDIFLAPALAVLCIAAVGTSWTKRDEPGWMIACFAVAFVSAWLVWASWIGDVLRWLAEFTLELAIANWLPLLVLAAGVCVVALALSRD